MSIVDERFMIYSALGSEWGNIVQYRQCIFGSNSGNLELYSDWRGNRILVLGWSPRPYRVGKQLVKKGTGETPWVYFPA